MKAIQQNQEGQNSARLDVTVWFSLVLMLSNEQIYIIEEAVEGFISDSVRGEHGFGYDPLFLVENTNKSAAELSDREKDSYSHRGRAARKMALLIKALKEDLK